MILYVSQPHKFPVLPNPQITSSAIKGILYFFNIGWTKSKYDFEGGMQPPAPWTGSATKPAIVSGSSLMFFSS